MDEEGRLALGLALGVKGLGGVLSSRLRTSSSLGVFDMIDPARPFFHARLKHIWANKHISELHAFWQKFLKTEFCTLSVQDDPDGGQSIRITSVSPIPADVGLLIGDAIHNLRCSLDYAANELLGWRDARLTFPMGEDREELVDSFRTQPQCVSGKTKGKGRNAAIEMAVPGIGKFIVDEICPYKAGNGFIWPLGKLDARDKHRLLTAVIVPQSIPGVCAVDQNQNFLANCTLLIGAGQSGPIARFEAGNVKIQRYGKPTAEIFLNETGVIEGARLFPTLVNMAQAVSETLDSLEKFASASGWQKPTR